MSRTPTRDAAGFFLPGASQAPLRAAASNDNESRRACLETLRHVHGSSSLTQRNPPQTLQKACLRQHAAAVWLASSRMEVGIPRASSCPGNRTCDSVTVADPLLFDPLAPAAGLKCTSLQASFKPQQAMLSLSNEALPRIWPNRHQRR